MKKNNHPLWVADKMVDYHFVLGSQINLNPVAEQLFYSRHDYSNWRNVLCQVFINLKGKGVRYVILFAKETFCFEQT